MAQPGEAAVLRRMTAEDVPRVLDVNRTRRRARTRGSQGVDRAWLTVDTGNRRGRRFYGRLGRHPTGDRTHGSAPPHAELLRYERPLHP